jgi:hypothetical protein
MIIRDIKKKIAINFFISVVFGVMVAGLLVYLSFFRTDQNKEIEYIKQLASKLLSKASEYQNKAQETKKYIEVWKTIPDSKKSLDGIKIDDVNTRLAQLAEKYYISNQSIKLSLPEDIKDGIFDRKTLIISYTNVEISFDAIDDVRAISFLSEFLDSLKGYILVTNFDIKKNKKYTDQDLINISSNKPSGGILAKIEFVWYVYRQKEEDTKLDPKVKNNNAVKKTPTTQTADDSGATKEIQNKSVQQ